MKSPPPSAETLDICQISELEASVQEEEQRNSREVFAKRPKTHFYVAAGIYDVYYCQAVMSFGAIRNEVTI